MKLYFDFIIGMAVIEIKNIQAVIFDLDGTLLNRQLSLQRFITGQYQRFFNDLQPVSLPDYSRRFITLDNDGYVSKDVVYQQLLQEFEITTVTWRQLFDDYLVFFPDHCIAYPDTTVMLNNLNKQGYLIGLISNGASDFQRANLEALGIVHYFNHILISEDIGIKKPDPLIFNYFLEKCALDAHATVYIGDHPVNDVYGAQQVGMNVIWKRNGSTRRPPCTDWIDDWSELGTLLQND